MLFSGDTFSIRASATIRIRMLSSPVSETSPSPDRLRIVNAVVQ